MIHRSRIFRVSLGLALSITALALVACEGVTVGTATPGSEPTATQSAAIATPTDSTQPTPTVAVTAIALTPVTGGRATATQAPRATSVPGRDGTTGKVAGSSGFSTASPISDVTQLGGATVIGADGVTLGVLLSPGQALNSICDNLLGGGAAFGAISIYNDLSAYGGPFGVNSPFNPDSLTPPQIIIDGQVVGYLSVSQTISGAVDPNDVLRWLGCPVESG